MRQGPNSGWQVSGYVVDESRVLKGTARDVLALAERQYHDGKYVEAAALFEQALDAQRRNPTLDRTLTRVLIDDMASVYGMLKNYSRANDVIEYGLGIDSEYPLFYYIKACIYAETGKQALAVTTLRRAFELRDNVIFGEAMPDPRADPSFQSLANDVEFKRLVDQYSPASGQKR